MSNQNVLANVALEVYNVHENTYSRPEVVSFFKRYHEIYSEKESQPGFEGYANKIHDYLANLSSKEKLILDQIRVMADLTLTSQKSLVMELIDLYEENFKIVSEQLPMKLYWPNNKFVELIFEAYVTIMRQKKQEIEQIS
jgi:hypothetical protein